MKIKIIRKCFYKNHCLLNKHVRKKQNHFLSIRVSMNFWYCFNQNQRAYKLSLA